MKILVTVPNTGWVHKEVVFTLLKIMQDSRVTIDLPTANPLENNQHQIINKFMAGDWDFWLSIDSDNPPQKNPLDLVDYDLDIVGCPYPIWSNPESKPDDHPIYWGVYKYDEKLDAYREYTKRDKLQEVDAIGGGCFLIARRVFENPEMRKGCFTRKLNPDGTVNKGNDISFCERAKEQGFKIFAHFDYFCDHYKERSLNEISRSFKKLYEKNGQ
ncbi:MAG: hypothetical protein GY861_18380 [bacterium]|nr:hypothetical protein [bacterium]